MRSQNVLYQPLKVRVPRQKILCADDDPEICEIYQTMFQYMDAVGNGIAALRLFQQRPHLYGLIIADFMMPGMDGLELIAALGEDRPPCLLLSSGADDTLKRQASELGVALLKKPVDTAMLQAIAQEFLTAQTSPTLEAYLRKRMY